MKRKKYSQEIKKVNYKQPLGFWALEALGLEAAGVLGAALSSSRSVNLFSADIAVFLFYDFSLLDICVAQINNILLLPVFSFLRDVRMTYF